MTKPKQFKAKKSFLKGLLNFVLVVALAPIFLLQSAIIGGTQTANSVGSSEDIPATFLAQIVDYSLPSEDETSNAYNYGYDENQEDISSGEHDENNLDLLNFWNSRSGGTEPVVNAEPNRLLYQEQYKVLSTIGGKGENDLENGGYYMVDDYTQGAGFKAVSQSLRFSIGEFGDRAIQLNGDDTFGVSIRTTTEFINLKFLAPVYTYNYGGAYGDLVYAFVDMPYNMTKTDESGFAIDTDGNIIKLGTGASETSIPFQNQFRLSNQGTLLRYNIGNSSWVAVELNSLITATTFTVDKTNPDNWLLKDAGIVVLEHLEDNFDIVGGHLILQTKENSRELIDSIWYDVVHIYDEDNTNPTYGQIIDTEYKEITVSKFELPEGTYTITLGSHGLVIPGTPGVSAPQPGTQVSFNLVKKSSYLKPGQEPVITNATQTGLFAKNPLDTDPYVETMQVYSYYGQFINKPHLKWDATKYSVKITSYNFGVLYEYSISLTKTDTAGGNLEISRIELNPETNLPKTSNPEVKNVVYSDITNKKEFPYLNVDLSELGTYSIKYQPRVLSNGIYRSLRLTGMPDSKTLFVNNFGFSLNYSINKTGAAPFYKQLNERTLKQIFENSNSSNLAATQTQFGTQNSDITSQLLGTEKTGTAVLNRLNSIRDLKLFNTGTQYDGLWKNMGIDTAGTTNGSASGNNWYLHESGNFILKWSTANGGQWLINDVSNPNADGEESNSYCLTTSAPTPGSLPPITGWSSENGDNLSGKKLTWAKTEPNLPVRTNQAPVWFNFINKSFAAYNPLTPSSTVFFKPLGSSVWKEYALLKDSLFTEAGTYVIFANYNYEYIVGIEKINGNTENKTITNSEGFKQVFAFEINNSAPRASVTTTTERRTLDDVRNSSWNTLGGGQYTNNSVRISIEAPSAFDAAVSYNVIQLAHGTENEIISQSSAGYTLMQDIALNGSIVREHYINPVNGNLEVVFALAPDVLTSSVAGGGPSGLHNGHYIISITFGTTGSKSVFDFYIDTTPIQLRPLANKEIHGKNGEDSMALATLVDDNTLVVENGFKLDWLSKPSGAGISAEYTSTFFTDDKYDSKTGEGVRTGDFIEGEDNLTFTPIVQNQDKVIAGLSRGDWTTQSNILMQAQYKIGEVSTNFVEYKNQPLFKAGIYLFRVTDAAGNVTNYAIIIDSELAANVITIQSTLRDGDGIGGMVDLDAAGLTEEPVTHNIVWGTHKALAVGEIGGHNALINQVLERNRLGTYINNENYWASELVKVDDAWYVKVPIRALTEPATNPASLKNDNYNENVWTSTDIKKYPEPVAISALTIDATESKTGQDFLARRKVANSGFWVLEVKANEGRYDYQIADIHNNRSYRNSLILNFDLSKLELEARNIVDSPSNYQGDKYPDLAPLMYDSTSRDQVRADAVIDYVGLGSYDDRLNNPNGDQSASEFKVNTISYSFSAPTYDSGLYTDSSLKEYVYVLDDYNEELSGVNLLNTIINNSNEKTRDGKYEVVRRYTDNFISPKDLDGYETDVFEKICTFIIDRNQIIDLSFSTGEAKYLGEDNALILQNRDDNNYNRFSTAPNNDSPATISLDTNLLPVFPYIQQNKYGADVHSLSELVNLKADEYFDAIGTDDEEEAGKAYENAIVTYQLANRLNIGFGLKISGGASLNGGIKYSGIGFDIYDNNSGLVSIETILCDEKSYNIPEIYRKAENDTLNTVSGLRLGGFYLEGVHLVSLADGIDSGVNISPSASGFIKKNNQTNFSFKINNEGPDASFYKGSTYEEEGLEPNINSNSPLYHQELTNEGDQLSLFTPIGNTTKDVVSVKPGSNPISFSFDDPTSIHLAKIDKLNVYVSTNGGEPVLKPADEIFSIEIGAMQEGTLVGTGRFRHFFSLAATAGNVYTITVQFEGTSENYDYDYADKHISFYSETYTVVVDGLKPTNNLRRLINAELNNPQQSFLRDYLNVSSADQAEATDAIISRFNGTDATAKTLRGYAFKIDSNFSFQKASTNSYDEYLKGNLGDDYPASEYSPRLDTYKLFYRKVNFNNITGEVDSGLYSVLPDDVKTESSSHMIFNENDRRYRKLAYGNPLSKEEDVTNGYYEIIECDEAGNYRGYYVYLVLTAEAPSVTFNYYNYINGGSQKTSKFETSAVTGVVNAIRAELNPQGMRNFEITDIATTDRWFKVSITNRTAANAQMAAGATHTMFTDGSKQMELIVADIKNWLGARMLYNDQTGNSYEIEIQSRFTVNNIKVIVNFAKAAPITYTSTNTAAGISMTIENFNVAHSLTTYKLDKANSFTSFTNITQDISNPKKNIFPANAGNTYLLESGIYKLTQVDNFGRSSVNIVSDQPEGALDFVNTKYSGGNYYATTDLMFEYNATWYQVQFSVQNMLTGDQTWVTMPNDFIEYSSTASNGIRTVKFKNNVDVHYIYRATLTSLLGETDERKVVYNSVLPDVSAVGESGGELNLSTGYLRTDYAKILYDFSNERFKAELTGLKVYDSRPDQTFTMGVVASNTVLNENGATYYLTLSSELGFTKSFTIIIEESTFTYRVVDSKGNILTQSLARENVPNAPGQQYFVFFTTDPNFVIQLNPSSKLSGNEVPTSQAADFKAYTLTSTNINGVVTPQRYIKVYIVPVTNNLMGLDPKIQAAGESISSSLLSSNIKTTDTTITFSSLTIYGYNQRGNYYYAELYYNNRKVAEIGRDSNAVNSFTLTEAGEYKVVFRDLAGNTHIKDNSANFYIYLIKDAMLIAESSNFSGLALPQMVYNGNVSLAVQNADKFSELKITGKVNGLDMQQSISNLTQTGYYEITIDYKIGTNTGSTVYKFFIINPNIQRLGIDFQFNSNIYIDSFIRRPVLDPNAPGDILTSNDIERLFGSLRRISLNSANPGRYEVTIKATFNTTTNSFAYRPNEEYTFHILIANRQPVIESSEKWGTSTSNVITFTYNPKEIYDQNGQVIIGVYTLDENGGKQYSEEVIIFGTEDSVKTYLRPISLEGTHFVEVRTLDGSFVLYRNSVTKTNPLGFGSILLIIIGIAVVIIGVVIFIIFRTKMKVR